MRDDLKDWLNDIVDAKLAPHLANLAVEFLLSRTRVERAVEAASGDTERKSSFAANHMHLGEFLELYLRHHLEWTREDCEAALHSAIKHCVSLVDWVGMLVALYGVSLRFDAHDVDEPYIAIRDSVGWCDLTERLDPECIVSYLIATRIGSTAGGTTLPAAPVTRISDRHLGSILSRGVTDYHVHLGGIRDAQALWRNILNQTRDLGGLRHYAQLAWLSDRAAKERQRERAAIEAMASRLNREDTPLALLWRDAQRPSSSEKQRIEAELSAERQMLSIAWRNLAAAQAAKEPLSAGDLQLEQELDEYLFYKSTFLRWHSQPANSNPGLATFRGYFRSTEPLWPSDRVTPKRYERSPKVLSRALSEYAAHIAQSSALRRIELRMGPMPTPRAYHRFFQIWQGVEKAFEFDARDTQIGFAIHFKRSLSADDGKRASVADRLKAFLCSLDFDSAVLHRYRCIDRPNGHAHRIVRLDFAGAERDIPPEIASFCMNLCRGDEAALEILRSGKLDPVIHRRWLWHQKNETQRQPFGRPMLGQSCHAGEDNAHPLEGLYCVASAIERLNMREGDTIGHGLALAQDVTSFDRSRSGRTMTVRGHQFDSLFWLFRNLRTAELQHQPAGTMQRLEAWLLKELVAIYGHMPEGGGNLNGLYEIDAARCGTVLAEPPTKHAGNWRAEYLVRREFTDQDCARKRAEAVPIAAIVFELSQQIKSMQELWLKILAERGIVLELNPSSNLRVTGSGRAKDAPFTAILRQLRSQVLATINTDNPGVFATRIENEYAIVMRAMREVGFDRAEALSVIERLQDVGLRFVYWPQRSAPGPRGTARAP